MSEKKDGLVVLSLFDGASCGYLALNRAGIKVKKYYASEIDKHAIKISKKNHSQIIHLGDVTLWEHWEIEKPDLIIGGSPCQGFSMAGKGLNFKDPRSRLFFVMNDIIKHFQPDYFFLENVKMKKEYSKIISEHMGVSPVLLNSSLVSAQNRERLYWFNWDAPAIIDKGIVLRDICERGIRPDGKIESFKATNGLCKQLGIADIRSNTYEENKRVYSLSGKSPTIKRAGGGYSERKISEDGKTWRKQTVVECERLQTLPDNYTEGVSPSQRRNITGNGWTIELIVKLFKAIPLKNTETYGGD